MTAVRPDRWDEGSAYDRFMGRWSRMVAERLAHWLAVPPGADWLDVGCGTGALLETIARKTAPGRLAGVDPSPHFLAAALSRVPEGADLRVAHAQDLPFESEFDAVVSGLVLNFVPDAHAAVLEMRRATRAGGTVAAYVWDYAEGMQFLRRFWDVATALDPAAEALDEGRRRFPLCRPEPLAELFTAAGLSMVTTTAVDVPTRFGSFEDYWEPFLAGQGPAGTYVVGLAAGQREALAEELRSRLPMADDGSIDLVARAWAVRGRR